MCFKRQFAILPLLSALFCSLHASAYDFMVVAPSGQMLYYTITSNVEPFTVEVSCENAEWPLYYVSPSGAVTIPDTVTPIDYETGLRSDTTYTVTSLGVNLFYNCANITSVSIPSTVTTIAEGVFAGCTSLSHIDIPASVTTIGSRAFLACSSLTSFVWPSNVSRIEDRTFENCTVLSSITIPSSLTYIGTWAFLNCTGLDSLDLPNSVVSVGDRAFGGCTNITTPIYNNTVFAYYPIDYDTSYSIPEGIKTIVGWVFFSNTTIRNVVLPQSLEEIGSRAFYGCENLRTISIPDSVTTIGASAFDGCGGVTHITIGKSVITLGADTFWGCESVTAIEARPHTAPALGNQTVFDYVPISAIISIPCGSTASYMSRWSHFSFFEEPAMPLVTAVSSDLTKGSATVVRQPQCSDSLGVVSAYSNEGYSFYEWQDGNRENPRTVLVDHDTTLTAYFVENHTVLATSDNSEWGTAWGSGSYAHGDTATLLAVPQLGYVFVGWQDGSIDNPRNVVVLQDLSYTASFHSSDTVYVHDTTVVHDTIIVPPTLYTLNVYDAGHGIGVGNGTFLEGSFVEIAGLPDAGYRFARWSDGDISNPRIVQIESDMSFTAVFEPNDVSITEVEAGALSIGVNHDVVTVSDVLGMKVNIYDVTGKCLHSEISGASEKTYIMPSAGVYIFQVGTYGPKKVVVTK